jgi:hypothetical protein
MFQHDASREARRASGPRPVQFGTQAAAAAEPGLVDLRQPEQQQQQSDAAHGDHGAPPLLKPR